MIVLEMKISTVVLFLISFQSVSSMSLSSLVTSLNDNLVGSVGDNSDCGLLMVMIRHVEARVKELEHLKVRVEELEKDRNLINQV